MSAYTVTAFFSAGELKTQVWGSVGCVVSYETWEYGGIEVWIVPQYPPYGEH